MQTDGDNFFKNLLKIRGKNGKFCNLSPKYQIPDTTKIIFSNLADGLLHFRPYFKNQKLENRTENRNKSS